MNTPNIDRILDDGILYRLVVQRVRAGEVAADIRLQEIAALLEKPNPWDRHYAVGKTTAEAVAALEKNLEETQ